MDGSWRYLDGSDFKPGDLGPGDFATNHDSLGGVTQLLVANGTDGSGDLNGLFIRLLHHPGYVRLQGEGSRVDRLLGRSGVRWAYYEWTAGSITNHGTAFSFRVSVRDVQVARFHPAERIGFEFHFWPTP